MLVYETNEMKDSHHYGLEPQRSMTSCNFKSVSVDGHTKYEHENRMFSQYATRNDAKYLKCPKCDQCTSTAVIRDGQFKLIRPHTCYDDGDKDLESDRTEDSEDDRDADEDGSVLTT
jgi:hypothetical protein